LNHKLTGPKWWNLLYLHLVTNEIRAEYKKPIYVKRAYSTLDEHILIYKEKNAQRKSDGLEELPVPFGSLHLEAAAIDLIDYDGKLYKFIIDNFWKWDRLDLDIYLEDKDYTPKHVHLQTLPPKSGLRIFKPY